MKRLIFLFLFILPSLIFAQNIRWAKDGNSYFRIEAGEVNKYSLPENSKSTFLSKADLTPAGQAEKFKTKKFLFI